jgi:[acyl-carrier-protein] S-malonyltransferase
MKKIAGLFPGQGSQVVGMGKALFEQFELAQEVFTSADKALEFSLSKLCFDGPIEELTLTKNAQPAILTVSYICHLLSGLSLCAAAGHSLGEYTALVAAGSIKFEDAVALVNKRGQYMQEAVKPGAGKMVAIMGPGEQELRELIAKVVSGVAEIANLNCPGQTVVAGDVIGIDNFSELAKTAGAKVIPLQVSAPFHCSLMKPAAESLVKDLDSISINAPKFPVYANVNAKPSLSSEQVRENLKAQVCGSVRWTQSMQNLIAEQGITNVVEFGPGEVLSKLMKRINKDIERDEVSSPESLQEAKAKFSA